MLIGLIPEPSEPKEYINAFLKPFVNDLIDLWNGVEIHSGMVAKRSSNCSFM